MSPREFDGATAVEVHEHYDADGVYTGHTVITRESMWDDESRGRALRLAEHRKTLCPCGCGYPRDVAHDPERVVGVGSYVCMIQRAVEVAKRKDEAKHKGEEPNRDGSRWNDGRHYYPVPQGS